MPQQDTTTPKQCSTCAGCGKVADDDEQTPWTYWTDLPMKSAGAVLVGIVRPLTCPTCGGSGEATS